jgi:hypothetical protein
MTFYHQKDQETNVSRRESGWQRNFWSGKSFGLHRYRMTTETELGSQGYEEQINGASSAQNISKTEYETGSQHFDGNLKGCGTNR